MQHNLLAGLEHGAGIGVWVGVEQGVAVSMQQKAVMAAAQGQYVHTEGVAGGFAPVEHEHDWVALAQMTATSSCSAINNTISVHYIEYTVH